MSRALALWGVLVAVACVAAEPQLDVPFFRQEKNGCGAASVAMVAHYWGARAVGRPVATPSPQVVYKRLYDPVRRGIPLADMKRYFVELGYRTFTFRGTWKDLEGHLAKGRPVIVGLRKARSKDLHFVVLTGAGDRHVRLNDPTRKRPGRMKKAEFEKRWMFGDRWVLLATP